MRSSLAWITSLAIATLLAVGCADKNRGEMDKSASAMADRPTGAEWAVSLDNIEACSCPTFCQCYFTGQPALHGGTDHAMRFCRFNNAFRVASGHYGSTNLDGLKFWMAGDLGGDFSQMEFDWAVLHFEPSATPEQRKAIESIVRAIFPAKWNSFSTGADAKIDWQKNDDGATANLDDGKTGEIVLKQVRDGQGKASVIQNVQFWAAPKNSGFYVMKNEVEAYRAGAKPFEFKGTNGFFTTVEMSSGDVKAQASAGVKTQLLAAGAGERKSCCSQGSCCGK